MSQTLTEQPIQTYTPRIDTHRANRAAALATYLNACRNVGTVPDPDLLLEHDQLAGYLEINPAEDRLVIEAQVEPGTLGNGDGTTGRGSAAGTLIANGMLAAALTFRGDGMPTVVIENLHEDELLVTIEDGNDHRLSHGAVEQS